MIVWRWLSGSASRTALVILALVALINFYQWGTRVPFEQIDSYDVIHYYLGAKYFEELGYYDLYPAIILVDQENGQYLKGFGVNPIG